MLIEYDFSFKMKSTVGFENSDYYWFKNRFARNQAIIYKRFCCFFLKNSYK